MASLGVGLLQPFADTQYLPWRGRLGHDTRKNSQASGCQKRRWAFPLNREQARRPVHAVKTFAGGKVAVQGVAADLVLCLNRRVCLHSCRSRVEQAIKLNNGRAGVTGTQLQFVGCGVEPFPRGFVHPCPPKVGVRSGYQLALKFDVVGGLGEGREGVKEDLELAASVIFNRSSGIDSFGGLILKCSERQPAKFRALL